MNLHLVGKGCVREMDEIASAIGLSLNVILIGLGLYSVRSYFDDAKRNGESARQDMKESLIEKIEGNRQAVAVQYSRLEETVKQEISNVKSNCITVSGNIGSMVEDIKRENGEQWDAFHKHGHKGLDGNNNKVTR